MLHADEAEGHGFTFTIGRGTEVCVAAIEAYAPLVVGRELDPADLGEFARRLVHDSHLRWLGPGQWLELPWLDADVRIVEALVTALADGGLRPA